MICTVKNPYSWETIGVYYVDSYTWASGTEGKVSITLNNGKMDDVLNNVLIIGSDVFYISAVSFDERKAEMTITNIIWLLSRYPLYVGRSPLGLNNVIPYDRYRTIYTWQTATNWQQLADTFLRALFDQIIIYTPPVDHIVPIYPFTARTHVTYRIAELSQIPYEMSEDLVAKSDYFVDSEGIVELMLSLGIWCEPTLTETGMLLTFHAGATGKHENVIFDGSNCILSSASAKGAFADRVYVAFTAGNEMTNATHSQFAFGSDGRYHLVNGDRYYIYYSNGAGFYARTATDPLAVDRVNKTYHKLITVEALDENATYEDVVNSVSEQLQNEIEYSIEFKSKKRFNAGDAVSMVLFGSVMTFIVESVTKQLDSDYYNVSCGQLANSVSKKLKYRIKDGTLYL